jgi:hypothetical protein
MIEGDNMNGITPRETEELRQDCIIAQHEESQRNHLLRTDDSYWANYVEPTEEAIRYLKWLKAQCFLYGRDFDEEYQVLKDII